MLYRRRPYKLSFILQAENGFKKKSRLKSVALMMAVSSGVNNA
jgi:hypothetical protein